MLLTGYKAWFLTKTQTSANKCFLSWFLKDPFKNTFQNFNNVLQGWVFVKSLRLWQTILNFISYKTRVLKVAQLELQVLKT
jgi:hypothetical protein